MEQCLARTQPARIKVGVIPDGNSFGFDKNDVGGDENSACPAPETAANQNRGGLHGPLQGETISQQFHVCVLTASFERLSNCRR
jgi:hypothetical protein